MDASACSTTKCDCFAEPHSHNDRENFTAIYWDRARVSVRCATIRSFGPPDGWTLFVVHLIAPSIASLAAFSMYFRLNRFWSNVLFFFVLCEFLCIFGADPSLFRQRHPNELHSWIHPDAWNDGFMFTFRLNSRFAMVLGRFVSRRHKLPLFGNYIYFFWPKLNACLSNFPFRCWAQHARIRIRHECRTQNAIHVAETILCSGWWQASHPKIEKRFSPCPSLHRPMKYTIHHSWGAEQSYTVRTA